MPDADLLKRLARLHNEVLKNPRSAFDSYARAFNEDPSDPSNYEDVIAAAKEEELFSELIEYIQMARARVRERIQPGGRQRARGLDDPLLAIG